ncbi:HlyD family secretion protein, partial [Pantoea stewartii]
MSHNVNKNWKLWSLVICTCVIGACLYFSKTPDESHQTAEQWYPIAPGSLTNTLGLIGHVEAVEQKTLSAPFDGVLEKINVQAGDSVKAGDMLFTMGTLELDIQIRNALSELLKTKREVVRLKNWDHDPEVHRLRRQVSIATAVLNNSRKNLKETTELYDRGIVARNEVDNLRLQIQTQDQDLKNAREDLATLESRADKDSLQIAEIAFLNAQALY